MREIRALSAIGSLVAILLSSLPVSAAGIDARAAALLAEEEHTGGCWIEAEARLLDVLSRDGDRLAPDVKARALATLARIHAERGDLATGESLARTALDSAESHGARAAALRSLASVLAILNPFGWELPETILELGRTTEGAREDGMDHARTLVIEATEAVRRRSPDAISFIRRARSLLPPSPIPSLESAELLRLEAEVTRMQNNPAAAADMAERACSVLERIAPEGPSLAACANTLAIARAEIRDGAEALRQFRRALAIRQRLAPGGRGAAMVLMNIGTLHRLAWGNLAEAETALRKAVAMFPPEERVTPLERLWSILSDGGNPYLETEVLCQMTDLAESRPLTGLPDAVRQHVRWWEGHVTTLLGPHMARIGQPEAALDALERSRGRAFLLAKAERRHTPEGPRAARLRSRLEVLQARLARLDQRTQRAEADETIIQLHRIGLQLEQLEFAAAHVPGVPRPLTAAAIRESLDDGTLVLVYARGGGGRGRRTVLLAVERGEPFTGILLDRHDDAVQEAVDRFRRLVARAQGGAVSPSLVEAGKELACILFGSLAPRVSRARRLVINADNLLARMPFSALVIDEALGVDHGGGRAVFLGERLSLSLASSLTSVYGGEVPRVPPDAELWAIGDPEGEGSALPGAREEALTVAALHAGPSRVLVGKDAAETSIKSVAETVGTIHFACHATSNPDRPESSALILAAPEPRSPDNGRLQAREIANEMMIGADLVVLSACTSSSAFDTGSEGPLGLARAFQIAGARRVLAATWLVPDEVTGKFMAAFYSARARGLAADRCLQEAQVALRSNPETAHPYYWAGFVLHGDGR